MTKTALITGITGQDGSYLAELLLKKNYHIVGLTKNKTFASAKNISHLQGQIELMTVDMGDPDSLQDAIKNIQPDEVYNFASQSFPGESWNRAIETMKINGLGAQSLFDAVRQHKPECRIYQASSSEMFGQVTNAPQNELTPFNPVNPYAAAKVYSHHIARIYRDSYKMFISCGILFNHESPRRGFHFLPQKVSYAAACLKLGLLNSPILNEKNEPIVKNGKLSLGNLDAKRDWGYAGDYVEAMWLMLQQPKADDFVIGTGQIKTIRELCETAFSHVGLNWEDYVVVDNRLVRPLETGPTLADASKAKYILGWEPKKSFKELIAELVDNHLKHLSTTLAKEQGVKVTC